MSSLSLEKPTKIVFEIDVKEQRRIDDVKYMELRKRLESKAKKESPSKEELAKKQEDAELRRNEIRREQQQRRQAKTSPTVIAKNRSTILGEVNINSGPHGVHEKERIIRRVESARKRKKSLDAEALQQLAESNQRKIQNGQIALESQRKKYVVLNKNVDSKLVQAEHAKENLITNQTIKLAQKNEQIRTQAAHVTQKEKKRARKILNEQDAKLVAAEHRRSKLLASKVKKIASKTKKALLMGSVSLKKQEKNRKRMKKKTDDKMAKAAVRREQVRQEYIKSLSDTDKLKKENPHEQFTSSKSTTDFELEERRRKIEQNIAKASKRRDETLKATKDRLRLEHKIVSQDGIKALDRRMSEKPILERRLKEKHRAAEQRLLEQDKERNARIIQRHMLYHRRRKRAAAKARDELLLVQAQISEKLESAEKRRADYLAQKTKKALEESKKRETWMSSAKKKETESLKKLQKHIVESHEAVLERKDKYLANKFKSSPASSKKANKQKTAAFACDKSPAMKLQALEEKLALATSRRNDFLRLRACKTTPGRLRSKQNFESSPRDNESPEGDISSQSSPLRAGNYDNQGKMTLTRRLFCDDSHRNRNSALHSSMVSPQSSLSDSPGTSFVESGETVKSKEEDNVIIFGDRSTNIVDATMSRLQCLPLSLWTNFWSFCAGKGEIVKEEDKNVPTDHQHHHCVIL